MIVDKKKSIIENILMWSMSYKISDALFALLRLGVLEALQKQPFSLDALIAEYHLNKNALNIILTLLVEMELIVYSEGFYSLPSSVSTIIPVLWMEWHVRSLHASQESLIKALKTGEGYDPIEACGENQVLGNYQSAMANTMRHISLHMFRLAKLKGSTCFVDLGGADGALSFYLSEFIPEAKFITVDRAQTACYFNQRFLLKQNKDRFQFVPGDLKKPESLIEWIKKADVIVLSNILHLLAPHNIEEILKIIGEHSPEDCKIIIYDHFVSNSPNLNLNKLMLIDWVNCGTFFNLTVDKCKNLLEKIGFKEITCRDLPGLSGTMLVGHSSGVKSSPEYLNVA